MTDRAVPRCFGYLRVSTERQAGEVYSSVNDQRAAILALAERLGVVVDEWFIDAGASGATAERRPEFMRLITACQANEREKRHAGYVLVLNDSRFGRFGDLDEAGHWRVVLRKLGWIVRYCESDDINDRTARAFVRLASSAQAHEYLQNIKKNAMRGSRGTAAQGFWVAAAPYGYRRQVVYPPERTRVLDNGVPKAKDEKVRLSPHDDEALTVAGIFVRYVEPGETLASVVTWLRQILPSKKWSVPVVRWILGNRAYVGDVVIGRRMADEDDPGKSIARPTGERWGLDGAHEPIVDRGLFERVAAKLAANRAAPRRARSDYALTGVLLCGECGESYVGGGTKPTANGGRVHFYRCAGTLKRVPTCRPGGVVMRHLIEPVVIETLAKTLARPVVRAQMVAEVERILGELANPAATDPALVTAEKRARERQERLAAAIADDTLSSAEAAGMMATIREELARIESAKAHEKFIAARRSTILNERDAILAQVLDAPARLRAARGAALRAQIGIWCSSLTYDRTRRRVRMEIRAAMPVISASSPRLASQNDAVAVVVREVALPSRGRKRGVR